MPRLIYCANLSKEKPRPKRPGLIGVEHLLGNYGAAARIAVNTKLTEVAGDSLVVRISYKPPWALNFTIGVASGSLSCAITPRLLLTYRSKSSAASSPTLTTK